MDKSVLIQKQIKDNAEDLHSYVRDLKLWEEEMKRKDRQLSNQPTDEALPPVRRAKLTKSSSEKKEDKKEVVKKKLKSYDYSSWEKFDVDKACEEIDDEDKIIKEDSCQETAEQQEKYLKEKALYEKELGNKHVKNSKWDDAIGCYTRAIEAYSKDPVFFANRALCYLKKKKFEMVESDCTASLRLDPTYVKAMLRRAAAREALGRIEDACYDLRNALKLEPNNTQALRDLERVKNLSNKSKQPINRLTLSEVESIPENSAATEGKPKNISSLVIDNEKAKEVSTEGNDEFEWPSCSTTIEPIVKPPHLRSKKCLKRIEIYDVGPNTPEHICAAKLRKSNNLPTISPSPTHPPASSRLSEPGFMSAATVKPRSILTITTPVDVPPPPTTSVQFNTAWNSVKGNPQLRYRYLKQIPGESLSDIFKDALESGMFSSILDTLSSEFISKEDVVLSYLKGLTRVRRFSTLTLFMSTSDKSNLVKLFDHCLRKTECSSEDINELRKLYEMS
ncbi:RNA polymerase II-associated protein 3-like [Macrosteles quadrilineatus]|uniref:RNA polymerase II-associated protein 3-like n=1 Tax=Macrosteles quadrilineatus TaxID=74068 RepID=UPI0023E20E01|nr:RNA polymerase II-associated protein 3-like [Macrosteles quadrilineatus]